MRRSEQYHLRDAFAGWQALAISSNHIADYTKARIEAGAKPATVNRELATLRRAFAVAVEQKLLPRDHVPKITLRPEHNTHEGFLEAADLDPFLTELRQRDPVVADLTEVAFLTGLRRGNVLGLVWTNVISQLDGSMLVGGELRFPGEVMKNGEPLTLPLGGRLLHVLQRRWALRLPQCRHVFHREGTPVVDFTRTWRAARAAVGYPALLFHDLRRSNTRMALRASVPEDVALKRAGWKGRSMLQRYNVIDTADLVDAQDRLDTVLATVGPRRSR